MKNLSQEMKRTRDKEARARAVDPAKNVIYSGDGSTGAGGGGYVAPADLLNEAAHDALDHTGLTGIADTFLELTDTPANYTGSGSKIVAVKADVSGLEFVAAPAAENGVPVGGTTNQLSAKNSNADYDMKWVDAPAAGNGLPAGGTAGQVLAKVDGTDYNTEWTGTPGPDSDIKGCTLWLKADAIAGLADGDVITTWGNSAADIHDYRAVGSPKYKTNIINSLPAILLDGGYFAGHFPFSEQLLTWFFVCKFTAITNAYTGVLGANVAADSGGYFIKSNGKSAFYLPASSYDGTGAVTVGTTDFNIITARNGQANFLSRINKVDDITNAPALFYPAVTSAFLGNQYSAGRVMSGYIAEFIVYSKSLTDTEITTIETYLNAKYALGL